MVADIKSERRPASNRNRWPTLNRNKRPTSSESAGYVVVAFFWLVIGSLLARRMRKSNCGAMSSSVNDEIQTSALNIALKSVERNARQLVSDAELLFDHGRYGRAAALGVLAVEEVGKYYLLKWNRPKPEKVARHHVSKQRTVATFSLAEAQYDAMERALNAMGLQLRGCSEPLTPAEQEWVDAHGGDDKIFETLKNNKAFMNKMASAVYEVAQQGLVREALDGTLSKRKELGYDAHEILADPNDVQKEHAEESILFAKSAIARIIGS
jgi:AbiV family abortive infection protein